MSAVKNRGLGRGLDAIFDVSPKSSSSSNPLGSAPARSSISEVKLELISPNPSQPRKDFDQEALAELSESISSLGLVQPITVKRQDDGRYIIISGERRYRASKMAGLVAIPAYVRDVDDGKILEMALVENIQRQDLNAVEIAISLQRLLEEFAITQEELAQRVGKKRSTVANYIRLLKLPAEVQLAVQRDVISMGHAKALINLPGSIKQLQILERIIEKGLSVRQTEELVKLLLQEKQSEQEAVEQVAYPPIYGQLMGHLERHFTQGVSIKRTKRGDGKIIINFKSDDDINNIVSSFEQFNK